jgi:catechol 2,3-dioxygenase-like lactoylglutathione lyase family enzyme
VYLSYLGLRVRDIARSIQFYGEIFGLEVINPDPAPKEWNATEASTALLKDPASGHRLELNYYPPGNPYAVPYVAGEELDHIAFRVDNLDEILDRLKQRGIEPEKMAHYPGPVYAAEEYRVAYVRDPDGFQLELFDSPGKEPVAYDPRKY